MKRLILWVLFSLGIASVAVCRAQEKIAISELLDFKTRTRALQDFVLRTDPAAEIYGWKDIAKFSKDHEDIGVLVSADRREKKQRYVVTWKKPSGLDGSLDVPGDAYSQEDFDRLFPLLGPADLIFPQVLWFSAFEEDGSPVKSEGFQSPEIKGFIMDLNGDGEIELMEAAEMNSVKYVTVHPLNGPLPVFAAAYEWGGMKDRGKPWGYAIRKGESGTYDILFGPKDMDTIAPEVVFRYDGRDGTWKSEQAGDHVRALGLKNVWKAVIDLAGPPPPEQPNSQSGDLTAEELDRRSKMQQAKPYRKESLAGLGNSELLAWMGRGRGVWDVGREHTPPAALPPDFWVADPKVAALEFVARNRPKDAEQNYRLAVDDLDAVKAPVEGTLDLSTWVDHTDTVFEDYFLRCSPGDSYLAVVRQGGPWDEKDPLHSEFACDIRKVALTYEEARRIIQTAWWLDRVRSKTVGDPGVSEATGMADIDTTASFQLATPQGKIEWRGSRHFLEKPAVSDTDESYGRTACLNLVALLVCQELPKYLAERWKSFDIQKGQSIEGAPRLETDYSSKQLANLKTAVAEQVRLFVSGGLSKSAAKLLVAIIQELDMRSMGPDLEKIAKLLPLPTGKDTRLKEIAREALDWRKRLGVDGTDDMSSFWRRQPRRPRLPPGAEDKEGSKMPAPPDPKFAPLDALYAEQEKITAEQSLDEEMLKGLRAQLEKTLRWFSIEDDPGKLYEFATENIYHEFAACRRLRKIDPARAITAVEYWKSQEKSPDDIQDALKVIDVIQTEMAGGKETASDAERREILWIARVPRSANAETQAGGLIATVADVKRRDEDREKAMDLLVPQSDPGKFASPAVDDFLTNLLDRKEWKFAWLRPQACLALAERGGGRWWDLIAAKCQGPGADELASLLPALMTIASKEGEPFRTRLRNLIASHLSPTTGNLDWILWAAWVLDLRELKPEIEKLATSNPEDVESPLGKLQSDRIATAEGRFHAARQVASLWNEEDRATRVKMLIALGLQARNGFGAEDPGDGCLQPALAREAAEITPEQRKQAMSFVEWCASHAGSLGYPSADETRDWLAKAREALGKK